MDFRQNKVYNVLLGPLPPLNQCCVLKTQSHMVSAPSKQQVVYSKHNPTWLVLLQNNKLCTQNTIPHG